MSESRAYNLKCPKCSNAIEANLFDSINVSTSPELRDSFLRDELHKVTCDKCEFAFKVEKNLLYIDSERCFMIYKISLDGKSEAEGANQYQAMMTAADEVLPKNCKLPEAHLVFNRTELVERIFLLELGLDVKVIEYIKYLIYMQNSGKIDPRKKAVLFNAQDSTPEALFFVVQDIASRQFEAVLQYNRQAYTALVEMFNGPEATPNLHEIFPGPYISARSYLLESAGPAKG